MWIPQLGIKPHALDVLGDREPLVGVLVVDVRVGVDSELDGVVLASLGTRLLVGDTDAIAGNEAQVVEGASHLDLVAGREDLRTDVPDAHVSPELEAAVSVVKHLIIDDRPSVPRLGEGVDRGSVVGLLVSAATTEGDLNVAVDPLASGGVLLGVFSEPRGVGLGGDHVDEVARRRETLGEPPHLPLGDVVVILKDVRHAGRPRVGHALGLAARDDERAPAVVARDARLHEEHVSHYSPAQSRGRRRRYARRCQR